MFKKIMKQFGMDGSAPVPTINPRNAYENMVSGNAIIVDVREPDEWGSTGSPLGSHQIALQNPAFIDKVSNAVGLNKNVPIVVCCKSGMRGDKAAKMLKVANFTNVTNVDGGIIKWISEKLPVS